MASSAIGNSRSNGIGMTYADLIAEKRRILQILQSRRNLKNRQSDLIKRLAQINIKLISLKASGS